MPFPGETLAQIEVVVDLAVENDDVTPAGGDHRLMSGLGKIDDRQPAMAESYTALDPDSPIIGTPMVKLFYHELKRLSRRCAVSAFPESCQAAHISPRSRYRSNVIIYGEFRSYDVVRFHEAYNAVYCTLDWFV